MPPSTKPGLTGHHSKLIDDGDDISGPDDPRGQTDSLTDAKRGHRPTKHGEGDGSIT